MSQEVEEQPSIKTWQEDLGMGVGAELGNNIQALCELSQMEDEFYWLCISEQNIIEPRKYSCIFLQIWLKKTWKLSPMLTLILEFSNMFTSGSEFIQQCC